MLIQNLSIFNFRNLQEQSLNFNPSLNLFIGQNAQGKTSILEALYFLGTAKSFRTAKNKEIINWLEQEFLLQAETEDRLTKHDLAIRITGRTRKIILDQKPIGSLVDYLGTLRLICFAPDNLSLVKGSPALRREFLDRHLVDLQPKFLHILVKYNKALKNKNLLLRRREANYQNLAPWNQILAETAVQIIEARKEFIEKLSAVAQQIHRQYAPDDGEISLEYQTILSESPEISATAIYQLLQTNIEKEVIIKKSIIGTHRDDLIIKIAGREARSYASQGQTRSLALSLKFAVVEMIESEYQDSPIILLDDLDSELDPVRLKDLYHFLLSKDRQIFISGTEIPGSLELFTSKPWIFKVSEGRAERR